MVRPSFLIVLLLLSACGSTQQSYDYLNGKYVGRSADDFFVNYGMPHATYKLENGGTMYAWGSGEQHFIMPSTTTVSAYGTGGIVQGNAFTTGGGIMTIACDLQVITDKKNKITGISIIRDTYGWVEMSRCHELFVPSDSSSTETDK